MPSRSAWASASACAHAAPTSLVNVCLPVVLDAEVLRRHASRSSSEPPRPWPASGSTGPSRGPCSCRQNCPCCFLTVIASSAAVASFSVPAHGAGSPKSVGACSSVGSSVRHTDDTTGWTVAEASSASAASFVLEQEYVVPSIVRDAELLLRALLDRASRETGDLHLDRVPGHEQQRLRRPERVDPVPDVLQGLVHHGVRRPLRGRQDHRHAALQVQTEDRARPGQEQGDRAEREQAHQHHRDPERPLLLLHRDPSASLMRARRR